jgi:hypothetical protein
MFKPLVRAALTTSAVVAALVPAGAASAQNLAVPDATGDVWRSTFGDPGSEPVTTAAGSPVNADLVRTTIRHNARRLAFEYGYADLRRTENRFFVVAQVKTDEGVKREIGVETVSREGWGGASYFGSPTKGEMKCRGLRFDIDYPADTVSVSVPRSCLSGPRWVQARLQVMAFEETAEEFSVLTDNWVNKSDNEPGPWSDRIRRG